MELLPPEMITLIIKNSVIRPSRKMTKKRLYTSIAKGKDCNHFDYTVVLLLKILS
jgi:hypothetical protein